MFKKRGDWKKKKGGFAFFQQGGEGWRGGGWMPADTKREMGATEIKKDSRRGSRDRKSPGKSNVSPCWGGTGQA